MTDKKVKGWLESLGLEAYAQAFADNDVDADTLPHLTAEDLQELGVTSVGHRRKMLKAIEGLSREQTPPGDGAKPPKSLDDTGFESERRHVTVLFADLAGYTTLSNTLDPEEAHALLNRYFDCVDGIIRHYGGMVDKHIGDSVMAVFGAPVAHEDDPLRAVRAALEIHAAMPGLVLPDGLSLKAHVGIANGQVVASGTGSDVHKEYTVTGGSVNLASRLQDLAAPDETLISEGVRRSVDSAVDCQARGEIEVKGFGNVIPVWQVAGLRGPTQTAAATAFAGRGREKRQFHGLLQDCLESREGHVVLLRGEAGIGKSRLAQEFIRIANRTGFAAHSAQILDFGARGGQDAVRDLVHGLVGLRAHCADAERRQALDSLMAGAAFAPTQRPFLRDLLDIPQPAEMRAAYDALDNASRMQGLRDAMSALLRHAGARSPLLLLVEDIHWADPTTLRQITDLAATSADAPILLVLTTRVDGDPLSPSWLGSISGISMNTFDLGPLREEDAREIVQHFNSGGGPFAAECIARAAGNPLFLEHLLRHAEQEGAENVPDSIQSLVLARADKLPGADKRALQAATVLGQRFDIEALRHVLGDPAYDCGTLVENHLILAGEEELRFSHALIRDGVYLSLIQARRRELHARAAEWYREREPVTHAEHSDRAGSPEAAQAYLWAAQAEAAGFRYDRALDLAQRGLDKTPGADVGTALTLLRADALHQLSRIADSIAAYRTVLGQEVEARQRCDALIGMAAGMRISDELDQAFVHLDEALEIAEASGLYGSLPRIHYLRGALFFPMGRVEDCLRAHRQAVESARAVEDPAIEVQALGGLADGYYAVGRMNTAHDTYLECVQRAEALGFSKTAASNRSQIGSLKKFLLQFDEGLDLALQALREAEEIGDLRAALNASISAAEMLLERGEVDETLPHLDRAEKLAERLGAKRFPARILYYRARGHIDRGEREAALSLLDNAYRIAHLTGFGYVGPTICASIALASDDEARRRQALEEAEAAIERGALFHNAFEFRRDALELALMEKRWDDVESEALRLEQETVEPLPLVDLLARRARLLAGILSRRTGGSADGEKLTAEWTALRDVAEKLRKSHARPYLTRIEEALSNGN